MTTAKFRLPVTPQYSASVVALAQYSDDELALRTQDASLPDDDRILAYNEVIRRGHLLFTRRQPRRHAWNRA